MISSLEIVIKFNFTEWPKNVCVKVEITLETKFSKRLAWCDVFRTSTSRVQQTMDMFVRNPKCNYDCSVITAITYFYSLVAWGKETFKAYTSRCTNTLFFFRETRMFVYYISLEKIVEFKGIEEVINLFVGWLTIVIFIGRWAVAFRPVAA